MILHAQICSASLAHVACCIAVGLTQQRNLQQTETEHLRQAGKNQSRRKGIHQRRRKETQQRHVCRSRHILHLVVQVGTKGRGIARMPRYHVLFSFSDELWGQTQSGLSHLNEQSLEVRVARLLDLLLLRPQTFRPTVEQVEHWWP